MRTSVALLFIPLFAIGCSTASCPVKDIQHVVIPVASNTIHAWDFAACAQSDQCDRLCRDIALDMAPYDVGVTDCQRVASDAGTDGGSVDGSASITLDITYREYVFCGV